MDTHALLRIVKFGEEKSKGGDPGIDVNNNHENGGIITVEFLSRNECPSEKIFSLKFLGEDP